MANCISMQARQIINIVTFSQFKPFLPSKTFLSPLLLLIPGLAPYHDMTAKNRLNSVFFVLFSTMYLSTLDVCINEKMYL